VLIYSADAFDDRFAGGTIDEDHAASHAAVGASYHFDGIAATN
jgi:hypothetical protein